MTHHSRLLHGVFLAVLFASVLLACGSIPPVLDPDAVAAVQASQVRSHIPEREVKIQWVRSSYGSSLGLWGGLVDHSVNQGRATGAFELVRPLQAQTADLDFQRAYWNALEPVLKRIPWLKAVGLDRRMTPHEAVTESDVLMHGLLVIGTSHELSVDSSVLIVYTLLEYYEQGDRSEPSATTSVVYRSEQVGAVEDEQAIRLWTANHAALFRGAVYEGIRESAKMVKLALACMGGVSCPNAPGHLEFGLTQGRGDYGEKIGDLDSDGTVVEETGSRVIFRDEDGWFFSIPRSAIREQSGNAPPASTSPGTEPGLPAPPASSPPGAAPGGKPAPSAAPPPPGSGT